MDPKYRHSSIQLFVTGPKPQNISSLCTTFPAEPVDSANQDVTDNDVLEGSETERDKDSLKGWDNIKIDLHANVRLDEWEARRYGSMAETLLKDVRIV